MTALTNPRVMQAMTQIQQGIQTLRTEAPELLNTMQGMGNLPGANAGSAPAGPDFSNLLGQLQNMNFGANAGGAPQQDPAERFRSQLEQLVGMGFTDREANIRGKQLFLQFYLLF